MNRGFSFRVEVPVEREKRYGEKGKSLCYVLCPDYLVSRAPD